MGVTKLFVKSTFLVLFALLYAGAPTAAQHQEGDQEHETKSAHSISQENVHENDHQLDSTSEKEFNPSKQILDHVKDSHEWHLLTTKHGHHVSVPLPIIVFSKNSGLNIFMSNKLAHGHTYKGFAIGHGTWIDVSKGGKEISLEGKIIEFNDQGELLEAGFPLDFSITKNVFMMLIAFLILIFVFLYLAKSYRRVGISEPKGLQGFLEPLIVFVEEDIAIPNIGESKYTHYMPYLLTVFFFILLINLMGLIPFFPFGANVTGNIGLTFVLASMTLIISLISSNKEYWKHIFNTPGVPFWLLPIMIPVEILGIFTKPIALMIRLFANITAGHIIVLSLIFMIFIFKSVFMAVPSMMMVLFMYLIELLVAFLQAYIFTLLSALFIGMAMPEHHHE